MFSLFKNDTLLEFPPIYIFNTETRMLEVFEPLNKREVKIYTCGPTVYDYAHIGNLRAYVFADILKRTLIYNGYVVNHTVNFTDFGHLTSDADSGDDKMMKGLKREGMDISLDSMRLLSDRYIKAFKDDSDALNIVPPSQYARASDYVREQIKLIETLEEKGYTYTISDGVYFDISKFPTYGRLGNIDIESLQSGARVEVNPEKKHPADFAVWKNGELGFTSRWGKGFPGWHIECSAMAFATLGKQLDIHTGGVDNIGTHHNCEIAQSESASGKRFSKYWMHSEHIQINNAKIAKSEGNGIILSDLIEKGFTGEEYRYWLSTAHYRSKVNFSFEALLSSQQALTRLKKILFEQWKNVKGKINLHYQQQFINTINHDLNTPQAISLIWDILKDETLTDGEKKATIIDFDAVLGIGLSKPPEAILQELGYIAPAELPAEIAALVEAREAARIIHNWTEADRLRDALAVKGYTIEDTSEGPKLSRL
jgi:cysteinyl-tRNA synthetase